MIRRNTWILLVTFFILVAVAFYVQRTEENAPADATPTPESVTLFDIPESSIARLTIENGEGQRVVIGRNADWIWSLEEPQAAATDVAQVESSVSQMLSLEALSVLEDPPAAQATGLDAPSYIITVETRDGNQLVAQVGNLTPIKNGYYFQNTEGKVYVASTYGLEAVVNLLSQPPIQDTPTPTLETQGLGGATQTPAP